jgi:hypothetical protein
MIFAFRLDDVNKIKMERGVALISSPNYYDLQTLRRKTLHVIPVRIIAFKIKDGKYVFHSGIHIIFTCDYWHLICLIDLDVHLLQTYIYCSKTNHTAHLEVIVTYFSFVTIRRVLDWMV